MVKPKSIHIYNSSAQIWEENKVGYVRVNGEWVPFIQYDLTIYDNGLMEVPISNAGGQGAIEFNSDHIYLSNYGSTGSGRSVATDNPLDITDYHKLKVLWSTQGSSPGATLGIQEVRIYPTSLTRDLTAYTRDNTSSSVVREAELDISGFRGDFYINVTSWSGSGIGNMKIYKIWLE